MKKQLLIKQCPDPARWYAHLVGQRVPFLFDAGMGEYASREPAGYTNYVQHEDAVIVDAKNQKDISNEDAAEN